MFTQRGTDPTERPNCTSLGDLMCRALVQQSCGTDGAALGTDLEWYSTTLFGYLATQQSLCSIYWLDSYQKLQLRINTKQTYNSNIGSTTAAEPGGRYNDKLPS